MVIYDSPNVAYRKFSTSLRFGEGKVKLFSDFDGTYLPATHKTITKAQSVDNLGTLVQYFNKMKLFLEKHKDDLQVTVTTGRNIGEFHSLLQHFRRLGLQMPLPSSLITKNGGDEYYRSITDETYYETGSLPFITPNIAKRRDIKTLTGWDGEKIRSNILGILNSCRFTVRQDPTTNSAEDYGADSTLHHVHDHFDQDQSASPWVSVLRQDGDLKFFIGLPKDISHRDDRRQTQAIIQRIEQHLQSLCIQQDGAPSFYLESREQDKEYGNHPSIVIGPRIQGVPLTKVFDTQKAVNEAIKENDVVFTAGDGSNDFEMLNPARYLKLSQSLAEQNRRQNFVDRPEQFLAVLQQHPELQEQWKKLPFIGLVIERNGKVNSKLNKLVQAYSKLPHAKIIKIKEGELLEGLVQGLQVFRKGNPEFEKKMSPMLLKTLEGNHGIRANIVFCFRYISQQFKKLINKVSNAVKKLIAWFSSKKVQ